MKKIKEEKENKVEKEKEDDEVLKDDVWYDAEEDHPSVYLDNEIGEVEPYKTVGERYLPVAQARVIFQRRKVKREIKKLADLKEEWMKYKEEKETRIKEAQIDLKK
jgi:hypothetical protein